MNIYVARQARIGFGTVAVLVRTKPKDFRVFSDRILRELEEMIAKLEMNHEHELVVVTALRINLEELKRLVAADLDEMQVELIELICKNVVETCRSDP